MPALPIFTNTPVPLSLPTSEERTKNVPMWHGKTQLNWPSEFQTATDLITPLLN